MGSPTDTAKPLTPEQRSKACDDLMAWTAALQDAPAWGWDVPEGCTRSDVAEALARWKRRDRHPVRDWLMANDRGVFALLTMAAGIALGLSFGYLCHLLGWFGAVVVLP